MRVRMGEQRAEAAMRRALARRRGELRPGRQEFAVIE